MVNNISVNTRAILEYMDDVDNPQRGESKSTHKRLIRGSDGNLKAVEGNQINWFYRFLAFLGFGPASLKVVAAIFNKSIETIQKDEANLNIAEKRKILRFTTTLKNYNNTHSRLKRIKEIARVAFSSNLDELYQLESPPIGIPNYGNSCFLATAIQLLLTCKNFIKKARTPVQQCEGEADDIFQKRQNIQNALIEFLNIYQDVNSEPRDISDGLNKLHIVMNKNPFNNLPSVPSPLERGVYISMMELFVNILRLEIPTDILFSLLSSKVPRESSQKTSGQCDLPTSAESLRSPKFYYPANSESEENPDITFPFLPQYIEENKPHIITKLTNYVFMQSTFDKSIHIDRFFELTDIFNKTEKYRVVGLSQLQPGHGYAYVRRSDGWYCCNDSKITKCSQKKLVVNHGGVIILESYKNYDSLVENPEINPENTRIAETTSFLLQQSLEKPIKTELKNLPDEVFFNILHDQELPLETIFVLSDTSNKTAKYRIIKIQGAGDWPEVNYFLWRDSKKRWYHYNNCQSATFSSNQISVSYGDRIFLERCPEIPDE